MVFRSRSVRGGGWGRVGLFAGQQDWRRARAAPGRAYKSQDTWKRPGHATSPSFSCPGSVCVCTLCVHKSPQGSAARWAGKMGLLSCGSAPPVVRALAQGIANLLVGFGMPTLCKGATQPRTQQ